MTYGKKKVASGSGSNYFAPWEEAWQNAGIQSAALSSNIKKNQLASQQQQSNNGGAGTLPVCGDLSGTRIHSVSHSAQAPIINHENGRCVLDSSTDLNEVLRRNNANYGSQNQQQQQKPYTTALPTTTATATSAGTKTNNNANNNNTGANNITLNNPVASTSRAQAAPMSSPIALTAAAASALAPVATAAQQLAGSASATAQTLATTLPLAQEYPPKAAPCCALPWVLFLVLSGIAIAVLLSVIFGHKNAKQCGRTIDFFGTHKYQYTQQQQPQANYSYASASSQSPTILSPTPAQQATLVAQQSAGSIGQDFSNVVSGLKTELTSILH